MQSFNDVCRCRELVKVFSCDIPSMVAHTELPTCTKKIPLIVMIENEEFQITPTDDVQSLLYFNT